MEEKGYTFIELLVVIGITGIITVIGISTITPKIPHYRLNAAARALVSDLRLARQMAITEREKVKIILEPELERYYIERESSNGVYISCIVDYQDKKQGYAGINLVSFSNSSSKNIIEFSSRGTTNDWGTILLQNMDEERRITIISTGRVKIKPVIKS
ncbi:MAG: GspH/FimT family pseudopilin [Nitrospirota bacterium]